MELGESGGEAIAEQCLLGVGLVFVAAATGGAEIAEEAGAFLTGLGREHLGGFGDGVERGAGETEPEEVAGLHDFQTDETVDERVSKFANDGIEAALRRAFGLGVVLNEGGQRSADR